MSVIVGSSLRYNGKRAAKTLYDTVTNSAHPILRHHDDFKELDFISQPVGIAPGAQRATADAGTVTLGGFMLFLQRPSAARIRPLPKEPHQRDE